MKQGYKNHTFTFIDLVLQMVLYNQEDKFLVVEKKNVDKFLEVLLNLIFGNKDHNFAMKMIKKSIEQ